jgi:hypothetical protein
VSKFYQRISAFLVLVVLVGSVPNLACTPAVCAANVECASVHCSCCGPNCPWPKESHESRQHKTGCNQQCPLISAASAVTINKVQPLAPAMLAAAEVRPVLFERTGSRQPSILQSAALDPPTLLGLSCALTV